jgi:hypothetical protein
VDRDEVWGEQTSGCCVADFSSGDIVGALSEMDGQWAMLSALVPSLGCLEVAFQFERVRHPQTWDTYGKPVVEEIGPRIVVDYGGDAAQQILQGSEQQCVGLG